MCIEHYNYTHLYEEISINIYIHCYVIFCLTRRQTARAIEKKRKIYEKRKKSNGNESKGERERERERMKDFQRVACFELNIKG